VTAITLGAFRTTCRKRKEVEAMFKELTDELLDLTATMQSYHKAYLAQTRRPGSLCCSCSCCTVVAQ
jgi:hypothetical protein